MSTIFGLQRLFSSKTISKFLFLGVTKNDSREWRKYFKTNIVRLIFVLTHLYWPLLDTFLLFNNKNTYHWRYYAKKRMRKFEFISSLSRLAGDFADLAQREIQGEDAKICQSYVQLRNLIQELTVAIVSSNRSRKTRIIRSVFF